VRHDSHKKAPAALTAKGQKFSTGESYHIVPRLSTAAEIILLALQAPTMRTGCGLPAMTGWIKFCAAL